MNIQKQLIDLRKSAGLTQNMLAAKINYSDKVISKWECGESLPDIVALNTLSKFYGVSIERMINQAETENTAEPGGVRDFENPRHCLQKYKLPAIFLHVLLLALVFGFYIAQYAIFGFFSFGVYDGISHAHYVADLFTTVTLVCTGLLLGLSVLDLIFVYTGIDRKVLSTVIFSFIMAAIIMWIVSMCLYGTNANLANTFIINIFLQIICLVALTVWGYVLRAKLLKERKIENR